MHSERELWKYLDGEMSAAEAEAIAAAAQSDEALRGRIDELRAIKAEVLAGAPEPAPDFAERVAAMAATAVQSLAPVLDLDEARRYLRRVLVAAAILGAVGMAYLCLGWLPDLLEPPRIQANPLLGGK
jgi:anti-sigma factor RsiW